MRSWKRGFLMFVVVFTGMLIVSDAEAQLLRRRRWRNNNYSGSYNTRSYGTTYGTYGAGASMAMPRAEVTAPGVGVTTGPGGVGVAAPGVDVDAGAARTGAGGQLRGGANINTPGANVGVGAGAGARAGAAGANIRGDAGADIRVRGQTPDRDLTQPLPPPAP
jgi:hypothetical protein